MFPVAIRTYKTHRKANGSPGFIPKVDRFKETQLEIQNMCNFCASLFPDMFAYPLHVLVFCNQLHLSASLD